MKKRYLPFPKDGDPDQSPTFGQRERKKVYLSKGTEFC